MTNTAAWPVTIIKVYCIFQSYFSLISNDFIIFIFRSYRSEIWNCSICRIYYNKNEHRTLVSDPCITARSYIHTVNSLIENECMLNGYLVSTIRNSDIALIHTYIFSKSKEFKTHDKKIYTKNRMKVSKLIQQSTIFRFDFHLSRSIRKETGNHTFRTHHISSWTSRTCVGWGSTSGNVAAATHFIEEIICRKLRCGVCRVLDLICTFRSSYSVCRCLSLLLLYCLLFTEEKVMDTLACVCVY